MVATGETGGFEKNVSSFFPFKNTKSLSNLLASCKFLK
jgi:hypothetical protein